MIVALSIICGVLLILGIIGWGIGFYEFEQRKNLFPCTLLLNFKENKEDKSEKIITDLSEYATDGIVSMTLVLPLLSYVNTDIRLIDTSYIFAHVIMRKKGKTCELVKLGEEGPVQI